MPYVKTKYINGKIVPFNWTEQITKKKPWYYDTINKLDWTDQAILPKPYKDSSGYFTGIKYNYVNFGDEEETTTSNLSNYNDALEINSVRDIVLGSFNPNMKHSTWFGETIAKIPILNIIPNTLQHMYDHYIQPSLKGDFNIAGLNLLMGAGETLDVVANPIKAIAISAWNGDNVGEALLQSTFGDETGIHNFDYDTGNRWLDLGLEVISDPLNWVSLGGKTAVKITTETGFELTIDSTKFATKKGLKEIAKELTEKSGTKVTVQQLEEAIALTGKKYSRKMGTSMAWFKGDDVAKKGLLDPKLQAELLDAGKTKYTKIFTKNLNDIAGTSIKLTDDDLLTKAINQYVKKLNDKTFLDLSTNVINSLGYKGIDLENEISKWLLKSELKLSGVYPAYKTLKGGKTAVGQYLTNRTMSKAVNHVANEILSMKDNFLKAGEYDGAHQVIINELDLRINYSDLKAIQEVKHITPDEIANYYALQIKFRVSKALEALQQTDVSAATKRNEVLNIFQSLDSHTQITSIDQVLDYIYKFEQDYCKDVGKQIVESPFTELKRTIRDIKKNLKYLEKVDEAKVFLDKNAANIKLAKDVESLQRLNTEHKYTVKTMLDRLPKTRVYAAISTFPLETLNKLISEATPNSTIFQEVTKELYIAIKQFSDNMDRLPNADDFQYIIDLIDHIRPLTHQSKLSNEYIESLKDLYSAIDIIKNKYVAKDYGRTIDPKYYELLFPIDTELSTDYTIRRLNTDLVTALENVPNISIKKDFTQTKLYRDAYILTRRATQNENLINNIETRVHNFYKDVTKERINRTTDIVRRIAKIAHIDEAQTVDTLSYATKDSLVDAIKSVSADSNILSTMRFPELIKNIDTIEKFIIDQFDESNDFSDYLKSLYFNDPQTLTRKLRAQIVDFKNILFKIERVQDEEKYVVLYKKLHEVHHNLFLTLEQVKNLTDESIKLKAGAVAVTKNMDKFDAQQIKELRPTSEQLHFFTPGITLEEALKILPGDNIREASKILDDLENVLTTLNPELYTSKQLQIQYDTWYAKFKLEKTFVQDQFDNLPSLKRMFEDPKIRSLTDTIINTKNSKKLDDMFTSAGYNKETKDALIMLAVTRQAITNRSRAFTLMDDYVKSLKFAGKKKQLAFAAAHTTLDYSKYKDIFDTNGEALAKEFTKYFESYMNATDMTLKKKSLDKLIKDYAAKRNVPVKTIEDEILETVKAIPDIDMKYATRHSALYDTVAQVKIYNNLHPDKPFYGYMMDTETTKLLDKYGNTNGKLTEIAVIFVDDNGTITAPFNKAIQVTPETYKQYYAQTKHVLASMGIDPQEWKAKYITDTDKYLEINLLQDFEEFMTTHFREGIPVSTFNGDKFDWQFIAYKMKKELGREDIVAQIEQIDPIDIYTELSKKHFKLTDAEYTRLVGVFDEIIRTQRETLAPFRTVTGYPVKVTMGMGGTFIEGIKPLIDLDSLNKLKNTSMSKNLNDLLLLDGFDDDGALIDRLTEVINSAKNLGINQDIFKNEVPQNIKEYLYDICREYVDLARDVKYINEEFKDALITSIGIDELHPQYNAKIKRVLNKLAQKFIRELPESPYKKNLIKNFQGVNNLTQLLALGTDTDSIVAFKKYSGEIFALWDAIKQPINANNIDSISNALVSIIKTNDSLYNVDSMIPYADEIYEMLAQIKASNLTEFISGIQIDTDNLQFAYAELDYFMKHLTRISESNAYARLGAEKLLKNLKQAHPELAKFVEDGTPMVRVSVEGNSLNFIRPSTVKWTAELDQTAELLALKDFSKRNVSTIHSLLNTTDQMQSIMKRCTSAGVLHQDLIDEQLKNANRKAIKLYKATGYQTTQTRFAYHLHNVLTYKEHPDKLISEILYSNKDHVLTLLKPKNNRYFNNLDNYISFIQDTEALEEAGIKIINDPENNRIILALDNKKLKIGINKNKGTRAYYTINGEPIEPNTLTPMSYDTFRTYVSGPHEYTEKMYQWLRSLEHMQPEMSGRSGITNYFEQYDELREMNTFREYDYSTFINGDTYMPFTNNAYVGEYDEMIKDIGPLYLDALYLYSNPSSKITTHLAKHIEYGQFVYESGLRLDSDIFAKMDPKELTNWLNENPNFVAVYLADAERAIGGFEIRRISTFNETTLREARRLKATIIPYEQYVRSANAINNYHYNNTFERIFGKIATLYKKGFLFNPGVIIRNIIDSGMKNYIEGENIPDTTMNYIKATDLYYKYTKVMRDIQNMDVNKRYRLQNAVDYFSTKNRLLDSETYHFIYNFMNENGMNTLQTTSNDLFSWAMKPMAYVEKINRLTQYLNLEDQGLEYSEIIRKITETHFDYSIKTQADFITQIYIPFWTYASNNIDYVAHLIDDHPSFLRNYFNVYTPIWDFDAMNYEELEQNTSLQAQILSGNLPLDMFGYEDKEFVRQIKTKYGVQMQKVTNTATLKMGSSILDGFGFFLNPYHYIKEKLAPPYQAIADTVTGFAYAAVGNSDEYSVQDYLNAETEYQRNFGSTTIPALFKDPTKLLDLVPGVGVLKQRYTYTDGLGQTQLGSPTGYRTQNNILGALPSVFGATSRWGEFLPTSRRTYNYPRRTYNYGYSRSYYGKRYYYPRNYFYVRQSGKSPYSKYRMFLYTAARPDQLHKQIARQNSGRMQSAPQYIHSYMGRTMSGKSKLRMWSRMSSHNRAKFMAQRYSRP
jgi:hypothetical protein